jgi:uncharacterized protein DUF4129
LTGAALLAPAPAGAQSQNAGLAEVRAKAQGVLADPRIQRELPAHPEPKEIGLSGARLDPPPPPVSLPVVRAGAFLARTVFLVLLVVAVVLLGVWLLGKIPRWRSEEETGADRRGEEPAAAPDREPAFEDAARLAAEGRYAEAIHTLLLAAIRLFAERSRTAVQPSRTSRELIRLLPLGAETREAFSELVRDVELSLFGGAPVSLEDYERSLSRFRVLTRRLA